MISEGDHVKLARFVLLTVSEEAQTLDSVFVISRIIKISVRVLSLGLRLLTPSSTLIILDITKTSSNNCLLNYIFSDIFTENFTPRSIEENNKLIYTKTVFNSLLIPMYICDFSTCKSRKKM